MDAEQIFPLAQQADPSALRLYWLQQSNLTAGWRFPHAHRRHWLQQKNLTAAQNVLHAQHTESTACKRSWLQQINLIVVQRFPYAQHAKIVYSQTTLTAANKSGCCATFSVCSAYDTVCWQTAPYAGQTNILQETDLLPSIKIWVLGDRYWCSASRFDWVIRDESSNAKNDRGGLTPGVERGDASTGGSRVFKKVKHAAQWHLE